MDAHIAEDDIGIRDATGQAKLTGQRQRSMEKYIVDRPVTLPKLAIEVAVVVVRVGTV